MYVNFDKYDIEAISNAIWEYHCKHDTTPKNICDIDNKITDTISTKKIHDYAIYELMNIEYLIDNYIKILDKKILFHIAKNNHDNINFFKLLKNNAIQCNNKVAKIIDYHLLYDLEIEV